MARPPALQRDTPFRLIFGMQSVRLTDDQFYRLCRDNPDFRIEMTAERELIVMSPAGGETGRKNAIITRDMSIWTAQDGTGVSFDSSTGFALPNGAKRSPGASWILGSRWHRLSSEEREKFPPLCPDFVIELRSPSDQLEEVQEKMEEYIHNGAKLGWLLDPLSKRAYIYRPGQPAECIDDPEWITGDPALPGFRFNFIQII